MRWIAACLYNIAGRKNQANKMSKLNTVVSIKAMTKSAYESERAEIESNYLQGVNYKAKKDQALAKLFDRSGWTQEQLAEMEGKSQNHISEKLKFGAFIHFIASGDNPQIPANLTERKFRGYWLKTQGDTRKRFLEVNRMIEETAELMIVNQQLPKGTSKKIIEKFGDGDWHLLKSYSGFIKRDEKKTLEHLRNMKKQGTGKCVYEERKYGASSQYRIIKGEKKEKLIKISIISKEIQPVLEELKAESKKSMAHFNPTHIAYLAIQIEKILNKLAK